MSRLARPHGLSTQISCGPTYSAAVARSGRLYTWGSSTCLGAANGQTRWIPRPVGGPLLRLKVAQVSCGTFHCAAVTSKGSLFTWGDGFGGRLGHGDEAVCPEPRRVSALAACTVLQVACGCFHTGERCSSCTKARCALTLSVFLSLRLHLFRNLSSREPRYGPRHPGPVPCRMPATCCYRGAAPCFTSSRGGVATPPRLIWPPHQTLRLS